MKEKLLNLLGSYGVLAKLTEEPGPLSFLNSQWSNLGDWKIEARKKLIDSMSIPHIEKKPTVKINKKYSFDNLEIEEISWEIPYGPKTEAVFMKPRESRDKLPGILALHDHGGVKYFGKSKIIRTSENVHPLITAHQKKYYGGVAWANELAKRGYGVLIHDVFTFESRKILPSKLPAHVVKRMMSPPLEIEELKVSDLTKKEYTEDYDVTSEESISSIHKYNAFGEQHEHIIAKSIFSSGFTWPGLFVSEDKIALDYLSSRKDIDGDRVGCCGLSGGGLRTNYLAGIDERIKCAVCAGFMTTWSDFTLNTSYAHTWMTYIPLLPKYMDFPEILGIHAPLPSLVLATKDDPYYTIEEVERAGEILKKIYKKAKASDSFKISIYEGDHRFDLSMQEEAFNFFDRWFK